MILSLRDKSEKQEGSTLTRPTDHSCSAKPLFMGFRVLLKKQGFRFLVKKHAQPSKTSKFLVKKWIKDMKKTDLQP